MWNPNQPAANSHEEDDSWEVRAFAEDTGNIMGTTWPPRSYTCTFCRREFRSAQALGGHMNVHRRDRARLHQSKNPNYISSSSSSSSSSNLLIPTQDLAGNNGGLCLLYSLPSPNNNSLFSPLRTFTDNPPSLLSITPHPTAANFMNFNPLALPPHHNIQSSLSNSSNTEASMFTNNRKNRVTFTNSAVEEIDLELRLGRSSSSPS